MTSPSKIFFSYELLNARKEEFEYQRATYKMWIRFAAEFFLSYESLKSRKRRNFLPTSCIQGQVRGSQGSHSVRQGWSIATRRGREKEKKRTKEGKKVAPAKAMFRVPSTKNSFFWFTSIWVWERPILIEVSAPALFFYEEAMCKGSSGNGLLNAAKAVP
jgi:hypothetical protein